MGKTKIQGDVTVRDVIGEPKLFDVVILNDDVTTMDFVVELLMRVFFYEENEAEIVMLTIHKKGSAIVGTYIYDIAYSKKTKASMFASSQGFPLKVKIQPHKQ